MNFPARNNKTFDLFFRAIPCEYEGRPFNCGTEVLQGVSIFHSFQPVGVFFRDRKSVSSLKIQALNK